MTLHDYGVSICPNCNNRLTASQLGRYGLTLDMTPQQAFVELDCDNCRNPIRFTIKIIGDAVGAFRELTKVIAESPFPDEVKEQADKDNLSAQLNRINSVQDLLKLGQKNATEPRKRKRPPKH